MSRELTLNVTNKVLSYFRFKRRCTYIATEVGVYNSDVLAISSKQDKLIEIEVKTSVKDFKNDFKKSYKRYGKEYKKHDVYSNVNTKSVWVPNYFYFAVPDIIYDRITNLVEDSAFGLIVVDSEKLSIYDKFAHCLIAKKASLLHNRKVDS